MTRRTNAIRQTVAAGVALLGLLFTIGVLGRCTTGCAKRGTIDDNARRTVNAMTVEQYRRALNECIAEGKDAGSMAVYTACADEADKHFGGSPK